MRCGMRGEDKGAQRAYTPGGWAVYGDPAVRDPWLTHEKMRELDAWPHGGAFVREDGFGAWRVEGAISAGRLEQLVEQPPAMRCPAGVRPVGRGTQGSIGPQKIAAKPLGRDLQLFGKKLLPSKPGQAISPEAKK